MNIWQLRTAFFALQISGRLLLLSDAEIAHRLGRKTLDREAAAAKAHTLLAWYRKLIAKFDGSRVRKSVCCLSVEEDWINTA